MLEFYQVLSGQSTGRPCDTPFCGAPWDLNCLYFGHGGPLDPIGVMGPRWHDVQIHEWIDADLGSSLAASIHLVGSSALPPSLQRSGGTQTRPLS